MPRSLQIRAESALDAKAVRGVLLAAFPTDAESRLVDALRENGRAAVALVAEEEGRVAGYALFTPVALDPGGVGAPRGAGLAPLAVRPARQRSGVGTALVREGLQRCKAAGFEFAVVLGDPRYYRRFGFEPANAKGLGNEYGAGDAFRVVELRPGCLAGRKELVRYAPEFGLFGA